MGAAPQNHRAILESESGEPVNGQIEYTATFEVLPELGKLDVTSLAIAKPVASVRP